MLGDSLVFLAFFLAFSFVSVSSLASTQLPPPPVSARDSASTSGTVPAASVSVTSSAPVVVTSSVAPTLRVVRLSDLQVTVDNLVARALVSRTPPVVPAPLASSTFAQAQVSVSGLAMSVGFSLPALLARGRTGLRHRVSHSIYGLYARRG